MATTKQEKIKLLLTSMNLNSTAESVLGSVLNKLPPPPPEFQAEFKKFKEIVAKTFSEIYAEYAESQINIYSENLSEAAIDASIAFHSTALGQEIIDAMPEINKRLAEHSMGLTRTLLERLQSSGFLKEMGLPDDFMDDNGDDWKRNTGDKPDFGD
jgi:hypothetical protein